MHCSLFSLKTRVSEHTDKNNRMDGLSSISRKITPLTSPFKDIKNNSIQLWKNETYGLVGTVVNRQGELTLIPGKNIKNSLNTSENPEKLMQRLEGLPLRSWHLVWNIQRLSIIIWPELKAAGRYDGQSFESTLSDVRERLQNVVHQGAMNRQHYDAVLKEKQGIPLTREDGSIVLKKDGTPYDHENDVKEFQRATEKIIHDVRGKLSDHHLSPQQRELLGQELGKASRLLDESERFMDYAGRSGPSQAAFRQTLQQTGLTASYNSAHPKNPMPEKGMTGGDIGGVACSTSYIENLFDGPDALFLDHHYFAFPAMAGGGVPFKDEELQQILRELAIGIYAHGAIPFFSLHFQEKGTDLFPVIHPAYAHTLVGRVIGMLDYIMKGYLNGGIYQEKFIDEWSQQPEWKTQGASGLSQMIEFSDYCKKHMAEDQQTYLPLSALAELEQDGGTEPGELQSFHGFKNSFRIIARQKKIEKEGSLILIQPDFDVFYDINPTPAYKEALDEYNRKTGRMPTSYLQMEHFYQLTARQIHEHMSKMPLCRTYFSMLSVISFFSSYFSTLKQHRKEPLFVPIQRFENKGCPALFPHLPVIRVVEGKISVQPKAIGNALLLTNRILIERYLNQTIDNFEQTEDYAVQGPLRVEAEKAFSDASLDNMWEEASVLERRVLDSNEEVQKSANEIGQLLLKSYDQSLEVNFKQMLRFRFPWGYSRKYSSLRYMRPALIQLGFAALEELSDQKIEVLTFKGRCPILPNERTVAELQRANRVVGGCGLKMQTEKAEGSMKGQMRWRMHRSQLLEMESEKWYTMGINDSLFQLFKIPFIDLPVAVQDNFHWMESLIVEKLDETRNSFITLQKAIRKGSLDLFNQELDRCGQQMCHVCDVRGRTLLHHAATLEDPLYALALIKRGFAITLKDAQGYVPLHYAAMVPKTQLLSVLGPKILIDAKGIKNDTPLSIAILHHNTEAVKFFIAHGAIPTQMIGGYTDLHSAMHEGSSAIIQILLQSEAFRSVVNINSIEGGTPLMLACELGNVKWVKKLVALGASPSVVRGDGVTALEISVRRGDMKIVEFFATQVKPSSLTLEALATEGSPEMVRIFEQSIYQYINGSQDNVIHLSLRYGNIVTALELIRRCQDPILLRAKNVDGNTPLLLAAKLGIWDVISALWDRHVPMQQMELEGLLKAPYHPLLITILKSVLANIDPLNLGNELDRFVLIAAEAGNYRAISEGLAQMGAELDHCKGSKGWTLVHYLAKSDGIYLFRQLLEAEADISRPLFQEGGLTLVGIAAYWGSRRILQYLLGRKAPVENVCEDKHLLFLAIEADVEDLLLEDYAHAILDGKKRGAGHVAAWLGKKRTLERLKSLGVDLSRADQDGFTPLDFAVRAHAADAVEFLIETAGVIVTPRALYLASTRSSTLFQKLLSHSPFIDVRQAAINMAIEEKNEQAKGVLIGKPFTKEETLQGIEELGNCLVREDSLSLRNWLSKLPSEKLFSPELYGTALVLKKEQFLEQEVIRELSQRDWDPDKPDASGRTPLFYAIIAGWEEVVSLLVEKQVNLEHYDEQLLTPLALTIAQGSFLLLKKLVENGANINQPATTQKVTPIYIAAQKEHSVIVQYLLSCGANPMVASQEGAHLIHMLANGGFDHFIRLLVNRGVSVFQEDAEGKDAKFYAARAGKTRTLALLLSLQQEPLTIKEESELLEVTCARGHEETVRWLLEQGAIPRSRKKGVLDTGPYIYAASGKHPSAILPIFNSYRVSESPRSLRSAILGALSTDNLSGIQMLYNKGVGIDTLIFDGNTGLCLASQLGAFQCTHWLLNQGANVSSSNDLEQVAIEIAASNKSWNQFRALLQFIQPPLDQKYSRGETLMHIAAKAGNLFHLALLLTDRASVNIWDNQKCTPLYRAAEAGLEEVIRLLLTFGADPQICSNHGMKPENVLPSNKGDLAMCIKEFNNHLEGETIFHRAVRAKSLFALQILGHSDAKALNIVNSEGKTALELAFEMGEQKLIDALLDAGAQN